MKTFLYSVSLALTLIFLPATTVAGPTTTTGSSAYQGEPLAEMPMITSKAALKTFALEQVRSGYSYIWGEAIIKSFDEVRNITVTGTNADKVVKQLSSSTQSFRVRTYDKTKPVYVWSYLTNEAGDEFFQSNFGQVTLTETSAGLVISSSSKIEFQMAWSIPIFFPNAVAARIEHVGADGNRWSEQLGVYGNKVYYPVSYAGTGGTLIVTTNYPNGGPAITPGESVDTAYGLTTGEKLPTTAITGQATFAIQNHLTGSDAGYASATTLALSGRMTPPVDPAQNPWTIISPPTATFNVNAPAGTKRVCTMTVTIASTKLGSVEAWAHDASRVTPNGIEEIEGTVVKTVSGGDTVITVTWYLDNDTSTVGGSNWGAYLIFRESYEIQGPAQPSNYGVEKG